MRRNHKPISVAVVGLCVGILPACLLAQGAPQQAAPTAPVAQADDSSSLRDPFWPPDYTPAPVFDDTPTPATPQPEQVAPEKAKWPTLEVKGITKTPRGFVAIIEDVGVVEEGQTISRKKGSFVFSWKIIKITQVRLDFKQLDIRPAR